MFRNPSQCVAPGGAVCVQPFCTIARACASALLSLLAGLAGLAGVAAFVPFVALVAFVASGSGGGDAFVFQSCDDGSRTVFAACGMGGAAFICGAPVGELSGFQALDTMARSINDCAA